MIYTRQDWALSEDLVQEVFKAAAERWSELRDLPDEKRIIQLRAIARNKAVDVFRRNKTARVKQIDVLQLYSPKDSDTHRQALNGIAVTQLWSTIRQLSERQFAIAIMRFHDQMTGAAIADELGLSTGTVSQEIKKIRGVLLDAVRPYVDPDDLG
jgi:RNA polymerase sigma factor (sigma-70 family)